MRVEEGYFRCIGLEDDAKDNNEEPNKIYRINLENYHKLADSNGKLISPAKVLNDKIRSVFMQKLIVKEMLRKLKQWIVQNNIV